MKRGVTHLCKLSFALLFCLAQPIFGQTARQYYEELKNAHGLNPLATAVCFPEEEHQSFALAALSSDFEQTLKSKGLQVPQEFRNLTAPGAKKYLWWEPFHKGIPATPWLLEKTGDPPRWFMSFDGVGQQKSTGDAEIVINWATSRYKLQVRIGPVTETVYGRCERIEQSPPNNN